MRRQAEVERLLERRRPVLEDGIGLEDRPLRPVDLVGAVFKAGAPILPFLLGSGKAIEIVEDHGPFAVPVDIVSNQKAAVDDAVVGFENKPRAPVGVDLRDEPAGLVRVCRDAPQSHIGDTEFAPAGGANPHAHRRGTRPDRKDAA